jgi:chemotaxis protein MotA
MFTLPLGFLLMALTIYLSVDSGTWGLFINGHAIIICFGGTVSLFAFTTSVKGIKSVFSCVKDLFKSEKTIMDYRDDIKALATNRRLSSPSTNPLLNHASDLWAQGLPEDLFIVLVAQARAEYEDRYLDAVAALRNLSKYPPALGMTGTVVGMVGLFANLGSDDQSNLGPSLALAMTATFFGLIIANGLVTPVADRLYVRYIQQKRLYKNLYQLIVLINNGEASTIVEDEVNSRAA